MKLKIGYLISGVITGMMILFSFIWTQPDGKLHITFCDVGQGDAAYVRFPDGRDMLVDGGPNDKVLACLGKHMPFWDRNIDIVLLSHPEKDHLQGLLSVFDRYDVDYFVRSDVANTTEGYQKLVTRVREKGIAEKFVTTGGQISVDQTNLTVIWPSQEQIARMRSSSDLSSLGNPGDVLGVKAPDHLNDGSIVFWLRYGSFDALFTGDADTRVEGNYVGLELVPSEAEGLADGTIEVLKVPHHGSRTGMNQAFVDWLHPQLSVISVGKNNYGHPTKEIMDMLQTVDSRVLRTDERGDISVISDGKNWAVED